MGHATPVQRDRPKNQRLAAAVAVLLAPFAGLAGVLAIWQIAADMKLASAFLFESGAFSHWAVWGGVALGLGYTAHRLNQYGGAAALQETEELEKEPESERSGR